MQISGISLLRLRETDKIIPDKAKPFVMKGAESCRVFRGDGRAAEGNAFGMLGLFIF
jgi:hypothetical protein